MSVDNDTSDHSTECLTASPEAGQASPQDDPSLPTTPSSQSSRDSEGSTSTPASPTPQDDRPPVAAGPANRTIPVATTSPNSVISRLNRPTPCTPSTQCIYCRVVYATLESLGEHIQRAHEDESRLRDRWFSWRGQEEDDGDGDEDKEPTPWGYGWREWSDDEES
jgi:hypothetical protein